MKREVKLYGLSLARVGANADCAAPRDELNMYMPDT